MKYKKVIIDVKEYLELIDESADNQPHEVEVVDSEVKESEPLSGGEKFKRDAQEFFARVGEGARDIGQKIGAGAKSFGEKVARDVKDAGRKIKEGAERLFAKDRTSDPDSKESRLIRLLPYMGKDETHEVARMILEDDELIREVDMSCVLPFLSKDDCGAIFLRAIEVAGGADLGMIAQYVDEQVLSGVVDSYLAGELDGLDVDALYPFLADKDIKKIFLHIVGK